MDHIETDKAFDEKFAYVPQREAHLETYFILVGQKDNIPAGKDEVKDFIHHRIELEVEKAVKAETERCKSIQKANLEQQMVYFFQKMQVFIHMSKKRVDSLWSHMCMWCDEYQAKPYKDIDSLNK